MSTNLPGISVIIPSYAHDSTNAASSGLTAALASLSNQTLSTDLFEVLVVFNGPAALDIELDLEDQFSQLDLRVLRTASPGVGRARNLGIASAGRHFVTFLDDDDALQPRFLETGLEHARNGVCVLLPILDKAHDGALQENSLNARISTLRGTTVPVARAPWALGFNACKVFPTELAQHYRYEESLRSGEDVAYFAHFLEESGLVFNVPSAPSNSSYLRTIRRDSVSRQVESFDFNVAQRLECIAQLREIREVDSKQQALQKLEDAQFGFIANYLRAHPTDVQRAIDTAVDIGVPGLRWGGLRIEKANRLVFSYCFPPFADTSANVTAKVIRNDAELVDVFYANMGRVRGRDDSTKLIVDPYLVHAEELDVVASFAHWGAICSYARQATRKANRHAKNQGGYESMYSRALWSASHVAGALFKDRHPETRWEAEFSDPLSIGIDGTPRSGKLTWGVTTHILKRMVKRSAWPEAPYATHFELTELVTLIYADEVIFTNANQQQVMLERYPTDLQAFVRAKSTIRHHAVPTEDMYQLVESDYALDPSFINIAYFGNFYSNRGIADVLTALQTHPERDRFRIHIFTSKPEELRRELWNHPVVECLRINSYMPYLNFLNVSTRFDALIVSDTNTAGTSLSLNPFLPSKYADYVGSGAAVWGIIVEGSPLSALPLTFSSVAGDIQQARSVLDVLLKKTEYNSL
ncbi:glycosyltransferase [uncultured Corynebacterium sp.]|uniref:glycosyltransferase family 2 protein n=1 Tax=uncultured Corynebacterium sp. TaxID=159447 RepID=UPI002805993D|nr:glycosyltransferase [uncultured Corynebacterium sp.]